MKYLRVCKKCNVFTLNNACPKGHKTVLPAPPKYSPADRYSAYRRRIKKEGLEKKGML